MGRQWRCLFAGFTEDTTVRISLNFAVRIRHIKMREFNLYACRRIIIRYLHRDERKIGPTNFLSKNNYWKKIVVWYTADPIKVYGSLKIFAVSKCNGIKKITCVKRICNATFWNCEYIRRNIILIRGDRGSTVVKVLCYKSVGRWFDPSWCHWIFHWYKILSIALWPWGRPSL